jgi:putative membrane protein
LGSRESTCLASSPERRIIEMNQRLFIVALALPLAVACKRPESEPSETRTTSATETSPKPAGTSLSKEDQDFMTKAARGGLLEVKLGSEAATKASSPVVKNFGNRMVTDHGAANEELRKLATQKGVTLPTQLDKDHQDKLDDLSKLNGAKFDKEYSEDMVDDHEKDVKEFEDAAKDVKDPDLRAWAAKTLPTLKSHLAMAKDIKAKTKY